MSENSNDQIRELPKVPVVLQNTEKKFTNTALQIAPTVLPKPCLPPIAHALLIYNLFSKSF